MKKGWCKSALLAILVSPWSAQAIVVTNLYEASLVADPLAGESQREVKAGEGLKQVFLKVTGNPDILTRPSIQKALLSSNQYVQQFSLDGNQIHFKYNMQEVDYLLKSEGFKIWGNNRPALLLWIAAETPEGRQLLGSETDPMLSEAIKQLAKEKGVPLMLPLLDLQDVTSVTTTDVWGGFIPGIKSASVRYDSDTLLIGHIQQINQSPVEWEGQWQLVAGDAEWRWTTKGMNVQGVIEQSVSESLPHLSDRFAIEENSTSQAILLRIEGIESLRDFAEAEAFLRNLNVVKQVESVNIGALGAVFKVTPYGHDGIAALKQAIKLDPQLSKLASIQGSDMGGEQQADLIFRWVP